MIPSPDPTGQAEAIRYYQPPGTAPALYLPLAQAACSILTCLFVTEGEKKRAKADEWAACFAIGGVWNWL